MKRPRVNLGNWLILLGLLAAVSASFRYLNLDLAALLQGDSPTQMARFAQGFLPPDLSAPLLQQVARGALETLAMSAIGTLLAALLGLLLALPAPPQA